MELIQRRPRTYAHLLGQRCTSCPIDGDRPGCVRTREQSLHENRLEPLPGGMTRGMGTEQRDGTLRLSGTEVQACQQQHCLFVFPIDRLAPCGQRGPQRQPGQHRARPTLKRIHEHTDRSGPLVRVGQRATLCELPLQPEQVDGLQTDGELVTALMTDDRRFPAGFGEHPPEVCRVRADVRHSRARRRFGPQLVDQTVERHEAARIDGQHAEDKSLLRGSEMQGVAPGPDRHAA